MISLLQFETVFDQLTVNAILDCIFVVLTLVFINLIIDYFVKRNLIRISLGVASGVFFLSHIFCLEGLQLFSLLVIFLVAFTGLFINLAELRSFIANKSSQKKNDKVLQKKKGEIDRIFDHEEVYKIINETVIYLSKHKVGALITFERKDKLSDIVKNGTIVNCPISFEILATIFYPGTRLHDGAVVIKDDKILAASVYYTPTTKPLVGKYGSRHRAAIGISEICDAVTIVVSEETGRISIAYNGELESYTTENFFTAFENIMSLTSENND